MPQTAPEELYERVRDATMVIVNKVVLRGELLARLPTLRLIAEAATGTDNIDLAWCREHKLPVTNIRGYAAQTVPEHVFMLLLALRRAVARLSGRRGGRGLAARVDLLLLRPIRSAI